MNHAEALYDALLDCVTELDAELENDPEAILIRRAVRKAGKAMRAYEKGRNL